MRKGLISTGIFFYSLSLFMLFLYLRSIKVTTTYNYYGVGLDRHVTAILGNNATFDGVLGFLFFLFLFIATLCTIIGVSTKNKKQDEAAGSTNSNI